MTVLLLGTLDTKGGEFGFVRNWLEEHGTPCLMMDVSVLADPDVPVDVTAREVAAAAGHDLDRLRAAGDRGAALTAMAEGARVLAARLVDEGRVHGVLGLGGSGGSSVASTAMRALPVGLPKVLVSTMASGDVSAYVGDSDVTLMYSVVDVAGVNSVSRKIFTNAAAAVAGMSAAYADSAEEPDRPLVAATMFGVTTQAVETARAELEAAGYEVLVFHATGAGGRAMEKLVRSGCFVGVLDLTTTEIADEVVGGVLSAGPDRLSAAAETGVPQVVALGAVDMVNFGPRATVPERFADRTLLIHNETVTLMRTTAAEAAEIGRRIGTQLARSVGPVTVFVSRGGTSAIDVSGGPFWDEEADHAAVAGLLEVTSGSQVDVREWPENINDPALATAMARRLDEMIKEVRK